MTMLRVALAGLRAHRYRFVGTALAVVLGVGFVCGTLVFDATAQAGFFDTFARTAKGIDVAVESSGPSHPISAAQVEAIRSVPSLDAVDARMVASLPMLDPHGRLIANAGRSGAGINTDSDSRLRQFSVVGSVPDGPGQAMLDVDTASHQHLVVGDSLTLLDQSGGRHTYRIVGLMDLGTAKRFSGFSLVGLPTAELTSLTGDSGFDEVVATARAGVTEQAAADAVSAALGAGSVCVAGQSRCPADHVTVETGDQRRVDLANSATHVADQFTTIVLIFGVISLIVAAFVIYNTFAILMAQRIRETALLRCVGALRRQVFGSAFGEAAMVGALGGLAGSAAGLLIALGLFALVNRVFRVQIPAHSLVITPTQVLIGFALGVVVTIGSALLPAVRATQVSPMAALRDQSAGRVVVPRLRWLRFGVAVIIVGLGALITHAGTTTKAPQTGTLIIVGGGVAAFLGVLIAAPLFIGPLTTAVGAGPARIFGVPVRLAVANAHRNPGRTAVTSAALMIGVGLMALFAVLIASISATAHDQLLAHYPVDYVVTGAGSITKEGSAVDVPTGYAAALRQHPEFAAVAEVREVTGFVGSTKVVVAAFDQASLSTVIRTTLTTGSLSDLTIGTAIVSTTRPLTKGLRLGDVLTVTTTGGQAASVRVVGSTNSTDIPGADAADLMVSWDQLAALAGPGGDRSVLVKAASGITPTASRDALDAVGQAYPLLQVESVADLSSQLSSAVTGLISLFGGLLAIAVLISLFGIANTLSLSVLERTRESAMLRAIGLSRSQLRLTLVAEAVLMGVVGALVGVTYGLIYGRIVLEKAFDAIGATIVVPWSWLVGFVVLAGAAALLAALLPARRAVRETIVAGMADT
jgi:putative ABC transport system permease protein